MFVTQPETNRIAVVSTSDRVVERHVAVGQRPWPIITSPDGRWVYVCNVTDHSISVIPMSDLTVAATIALEWEPDDVAVTPDGQHLYVAGRIGRDGGHVEVVQTSDRTRVASVATGSGAAIAVTADGRFVYEATNDGDRLFVIRTSENAIVANLSLGDHTSPQTVEVTRDGQSILMTTLHPSRVGEELPGVRAHAPRRHHPHGPVPVPVTRGRRHPVGTRGGDAT